VTISVSTSPALALGEPEPRLPTSVLALATVATAMILPSVHVWLHGAGRLVDLHVMRRLAQGMIPQRYAYVAREAAENRITAHGMIDAITIAATLCIIAAAVWSFSRVLEYRMPTATAVRAACVAIWFEFAFYAALYVVIWFGPGVAEMRISWTGLVPTELSRLAESGTWTWAVLRALTIGAAVRTVALATVLQRLEPSVGRSGSWLLAGGAMASVLVVSVLLERSFL
jgi:hypothetical protein